MESSCLSFIFFIFISAVGGAPFNLTLVTAPLSSGDDSLPTAAPPAIPVNALSPFQVSDDVSTAHTSINDPLLLNQSHPNGSRQVEAETSEEFPQELVTVEGDILLGEDRNSVLSIWSDAVLFYAISEDVANREFEILAAMNMISDVTCIRFKKQTDEPNYITFRSGQGCASFVGCRGGPQPVFFGPTCSVGNLCHELIHALGFHHEHTRLDRDQFIQIHWDHIQPGKERNFEKKNGDTQNLPYDVDSIMHYGKFFFSSDGEPTVEAKHSEGKMGQRRGLSPLDTQRLNKLYHCDQNPSPVQL